MKTLLLDIDFTLFDETTPRPHVKEFLEKMHAKYDIHFYTAGNRKRVAEVLRVLFHHLKVDAAIIHKLDRGALTRENCPMVEFKKPGGSFIEIKCFDKAAEELKVPVEDLIMLDDNPSYDHPHKEQIIQAEGFVRDMVDDDYLLRLISENKL